MPRTPTPDLSTLVTDALNLSARILALRDATTDPATRATLTTAYLAAGNAFMDLVALRDATAPPSQEAA